MSLHVYGLVYRTMDVHYLGHLLLNSVLVFQGYWPVFTVQIWHLLTWTTYYIATERKKLRSSNP